MLFDEVVDLLRTRAEPSGMLLVLDDLHRADAPSVLLLQALAAQAAATKVLVIGLYRRTEVYPRPELAGCCRRCSTSGRRAGSPSVDSRRRPSPSWSGRSPATHPPTPC